MLGSSAQTQEPLVFVVGSDPEPMERGFFKDRECPVACADADGPHGAGLFELERRMAGIVHPQTISHLCPGLDLGRQGGERRPEVRRC